MVKKIWLFLLIVFLSVNTLLLNSCKNNNVIRYELVEYYSKNETINKVDIYDYYYVEFYEKYDEYHLSWKRNDNGKSNDAYGNYRETENQYIVNANGMTFNYTKINDDKIKLEMFTNKFILKKAK